MMVKLDPILFMLTLLTLAPELMLIETLCQNGTDGASNPIKARSAGSVISDNRVRCRDPTA
jgi:hypothetical protein